MVHTTQTPIDAQTLIYAIRSLRGTTSIDEYASRLPLAERIVFRLNSDSQSIIAVLGNDVYYLNPGTYGGYIVKNVNVCVDGAKFYLVEPEAQKIDDTSLIDAIKKELGIDKVIEVEVIRYSIYEVRARCRYNENRGYSVVNRIEPAGKILSAFAVRIKVFHGVRRDIFEDRAKMEHIKLASKTQLPMYFVVEEGSKPKWDAFYSVLKIVLDASQLAQELQPQKIAEPEEPLEEAAASQKPSVSIEVEEQELELEGVEAPTTAVAGATSAQQPSEEKKRQLVKVYLLSMRLPSKYLVAKHKVVENGSGYQEIADFSEKVRAAVASRLEGIRREAYDKIKRVFCQVEEYGVWIAVTDEAVEEARKLSEWIQQELRKIAALYNIRPDVMENLAKRYSVKAVPVYLEPEDAKELLSAAIAKLSADAEELARRIEEAQKEKKRASLKRLEQQYEYTKALLEAFKQYLASIA